MDSIIEMPKYESYTNSGVDSIGDIPSHWNIARFHDVFRFSKGLNITKENLQDDGIPCVSYGEIHSKYGFEIDPKVHPLKCVDVKFLDKNAKSLLSRGDFIFADTSEDFDGSGNFTYLKTDEKIFAGYHTLIARMKNKQHERYLAYVLESMGFRLQVRRAVKGVKVFSITQNILKGTKVWFASEQEQILIAKYLDKKTAQLDEVIAIKEQQISLLKERKQIIIQKSVTQGLDPNVPMKSSGVDWIGEVPDHWEVRRSKFLFTQRKEKAWKDDVQLSATQAYGVIPQEQYEQLSGKSVVKIQFHLDKRKHVEKDDFVISMRSFQGGLERAWARGCIRSSYVILKSLEEIEPAFYGYLLKLPTYIKALQQTASFIRDGQDLNFDNFSQVDLFIPPIKEQVEIANYIDTFTKSADETVVLLGQQIEKLKEYKTSLINSVVTGKIKITPEMVEG